MTQCCWAFSAQPTLALGKYGNLTIEEARKQAKSLLGSVARGDDPIAEKKTKKVHAMTLQQVLNDYLKARKDLKPRTLNDYQCVLHEVVPDWLDKPLVNITRENGIPSMVRQIVKHVPIMP